MSEYDDVALTATVYQAVVASLPGIAKALGSESISGYALCTDDDLRTVFHVACPATLDGEERFIPVEWPVATNAELFDRANAILVERVETAADHGEHIVHSFACLEAALQRVRSEGHLPGNVLLVVTSTDPGPQLERLADQAVARLNPPELHARWRQVMGL